VQSFEVFLTDPPSQDARPDRYMAKRRTSGLFVRCPACRTFRGEVWLAHNTDRWVCLPCCKLASKRGPDASRERLVSRLAAAFDEGSGGELWTYLARTKSADHEILAEAWQRHRDAIQATAHAVHVQDARRVNASGAGLLALYAHGLRASQVAGGPPMPPSARLPPPACPVGLTPPEPRTARTPGGTFAAPGVPLGKVPGPTKGQGKG
jgi:hypothetical protein